MKTSTQTTASEQLVTAQDMVDVLITKKSTKKENPSADLIGTTITSATPVTINFRKGKGNVITCSQIEIIAANATGRRLVCIFRDAAGEQISTRRVYREWIERAQDLMSEDN